MKQRLEKHHSHSIYAKVVGDSETLLAQAWIDDLNHRVPSDFDPAQTMAAHRVDEYIDVDLDNVIVNCRSAASGSVVAATDSGVVTGVAAVAPSAVIPDPAAKIIYIDDSDEEEDDSDKRPAVLPPPPTTTTDPAYSQFALQQRLKLEEAKTKTDSIVVAKSQSVLFANNNTITPSITTRKRIHNSSQPGLERTRADDDDDDSLNDFAVTPGPKESEIQRDQTDGQELEEDDRPGHSVPTT
jgi:hypothetical protein